MFNYVFLTENAEESTAITLEGIIEKVVDWATSAGIKIVIALLLWFISFRIINFFNKRMTKRLLKKQADKTITKVVNYIITIGLKSLVVLCLLGYVGIETTSISAVLASLGVGVGLALNGALSNFAGGILIFITRPFKVDDYISVDGYEGTVEDIHIIHTKIVTTDKKVIYLPNGNLSSLNIINYSEKDVRRLDFVFPIPHESDLEKAKSILREISENHKLVLEDPQPFVRMSARNTNSTDISVKLYVKNGDYWTVYYDVLEEVKRKFEEEGINVPFNQIDVHMKDK